MADSFFELEVWKQSYNLILEIYEISSSFPISEQYGLTSQLRRSANSIAANIAESQGRYTYADRMRVLYIARGEIFETRSHIKVALGLNFLSKEVAKKLESKYEELSKGINGLIRHHAQKS